MPSCARPEAKAAVIALLIDVWGGGELVMSVGPSAGASSVVSLPLLLSVSLALTSVSTFASISS